MSGPCSPTGRRRIAAFAYACEPDSGSEPEVGWMWARMLAQFGDVWVFTRANNRAAIDRALPAIPERNHLHFVFVDLPEKSRRWKRGQRGIRLYYLLWQVAALRSARRMHATSPFDVAWHLTLANAWLGSVAQFVGARTFVLGPVGGGVRPPVRLLPALGIRGASYETVRALARVLGRYVNPLSRLAWRRADLIIVQNPETRQWLPRRHRDRAAVFPCVVLDGEFGPRQAPGPVRTALYAGRLIPWKGVSLAVRAIAQAPGWRLIVCGTGPDEERIKRLAQDLGVGDRVSLRGRQTRTEVMRLLREEAAAFLFPSLHDDSPFAVAEAAAHGLPVVCLDRGGPPLLAGDTGFPVPARGSVRDVTVALASALVATERQLTHVAACDTWCLERRSERLADLVWRQLGIGASVTEPGALERPAHVLTGG